MFGILKKVAPIFCVFAILFSTSAFSSPERGGEIPWPLSVQHVVTVENSRGLWRLGDGQQTRLFNVEMRKDSRSGFNWIRVAEVDGETYKVLAWGESFFSSTSSVTAPRSSFSNINFDVTTGKKDSLGRYITMYANEGLSSHPYLIRMVEVETTLGNVLGISIIEYESQSYEHLLGTRVMPVPLDCVESDEKGMNCYLGL